MAGQANMSTCIQVTVFFPLEVRLTLKRFLYPPPPPPKKQKKRNKHFFLMSEMKKISLSLFYLVVKYFDGITILKNSIYVLYGVYQIQHGNKRILMLCQCCLWVARNSPELCNGRVNTHTHTQSTLSKYKVCVGMFKPFATVIFL